MINLTDYWFSNISVEVDDDGTDNQENYSHITVEPEHRVGLAQLAFVEDTEKYRPSFSKLMFVF